MPRFRAFLTLVALVLLYYFFLMGSSNSDTEIAVIGSGLAGLTSAISLAESGKIKTIHLFEKEPVLGMMSNSNKASSGINGVGTKAQLTAGIRDTVEAFFDDTLKAGKNMNDKALVKELADSSKTAVEWLTEEAKIDLSLVSKLGGHSERRTHRVHNGAVGYTIIKTLCDKLVNEYSDTVKIHLKSRVTKLIYDGEKVTGLEFVENSGTEETVLNVSNIVLATGGFSASKELVSKYSPKAWDLPSSNGVNTTGDGIQLIQDLDVELLDMEHIQIHPTGFVDPQDPENGHKILAGEVLRGIGGLILNSNGERFVNEMTTRDVVSEKMLAEQKKPSGKKLYLVTPSQVADEQILPHVKFYSFKKLISKITLTDFFPASGNIIEELNTINRLKGAADRFGRSDFNNQMYSASSEFYVGEITPVIHFCMGGIKIDTRGQVLKKSGNPVRGLYAAGEVTGGVHGANRLGGSSLLECVVFGRKIAQTILSKVSKL